MQSGLFVQSQPPHLIDEHHRWGEIVETNANRFDGDTSVFIRVDAQEVFGTIHVLPNDMVDSALGRVRPDWSLGLKSMMPSEPSSFLVRKRETEANPAVGFPWQGPFLSGSNVAGDLCGIQGFQGHGRNGPKNRSTGLLWSRFSSTAA